MTARMTRYGRHGDSNLRGLSGATLSCRIMFIYFAHLLSFRLRRSDAGYDFGNRLPLNIGRKAKMRPFGNVISGTRSCVVTKVTRKRWEYVVQNAVRAGLVNDEADWPYQGEL